MRDKSQYYSAASRPLANGLTDKSQYHGANFSVVGEIVKREKKGQNRF